MQLVERIRRQAKSARHLSVEKQNLQQRSRSPGKAKPHPGAFRMSRESPGCAALTRATLAPDSRGDEANPAYGRPCPRLPHVIDLRRLTMGSAPESHRWAHRPSYLMHGIARSIDGVLRTKES